MFWRRCCVSALQITSRTYRNWCWEEAATILWLCRAHWEHHRRTETKHRHIAVVQSSWRQGCREADCDLAFRANSHCSTRTEGLLIIHVTHPMVTLISSPEWFGRQQNYPLVYYTRYDRPILNSNLTSTKCCLSDVIHRALLRVCKPTAAMALPVMCR